MQFLVYFLLVFSLLNDACADVILGGMFHGRAYRKSLTLRNTGTESEHLSNYGIRLYMNGGSSVYTLAPVAEDVSLTGGAEYVVCHSRTPTPTDCDRLWGGLNFNGDDAIELERRGVPVDTIGWRNGTGAESGGWTVDGVEYATRYHNLTRRVSVLSGNLNWTQSAASEWIVQSAEDRTPPSPGAEDCWPMGRRLAELGLDECRSGRVGGSRGPVIGTYNTYFLFDGVDDRIDVWQNSTAAYTHLTRVAQVIRRNRPDILQLAEVEDRQILLDLAQEIAEPEYGVHFVQGRDYYTGQDVGLISQVPVAGNISRTDCRADYPVPGSRCGWDRESSTGVSKNFIALFDSCLFGRKFAMLGLHLIAIPTDPRRCSQREGQARVLQDTINRLIAANFEVIVLGDFNDFSDSVPDRNNNTPTSRVLSMIRDPNNDGVEELRHVSSLLPQSQRYTSWYDRNEDGVVDERTELSTLDFMLMTEGLFRQVSRVWIDHDYDPALVSDHWPLFVEFRTRQSQFARKLLFNERI